MADHRKRGYGDDSIYFDHASECRDGEHHRSCSGRWRGSVSLGFGPDGRRLRRKVSGRTRTQVKDKLKDPARLPEDLRSRRDWRELEPTGVAAHLRLDHERAGRASRGDRGL
jgi:hypothetical protein